MHKINYNESIETETGHLWREVGLTLSCSRKQTGCLAGVREEADLRCLFKNTTTRLREKKGRYYE